MAALDTFETFNASLSDKDRSAIKELLKARAAELFAARSEDARLRVVEAYIGEVRKMLRRMK
ncbi:MAG: hypothetical protein O7D34_11310 [Ignavibacteria bacterium]|nr:hypothetical protein [Ignavibacteria bacterium]